MSGHGHVTPNADGSKARCGGPSICSKCALEAARPSVRPVEPLARTRPFVGQVLPIPTDDSGDIYDLINDEDVSLNDLLRVYSGCTVKLTIELIAPPPNSRSNDR